MKRNEAIKEIGKIYGLEINDYQLNCVGNIENHRNCNEAFDKTISAYNLLFYVLYQNNARLRDVTSIYLIEDTIYFDLKYLRGNELLDLRKEG